MKKWIMKLATFIVACSLLTGTGYALVKIFHFDEKFSNYFDKTDEELSDLGVSGNDVNITKEFADVTITITQTVMDEKELNIMVDIIGKNEEVYLKEVFITSGKTFNEKALTVTKAEEEEYNLNCDEDSIYGCYSYGLALMKEEDFTNGYVLNVSLSKKAKTKDTVTARFITNIGAYDVTFDVIKNDMKVKEVKYKNIEIFNEDGIKVTVSAIRLNPLHVMIDMNYNKDIKTITDDEIIKLDDTIYNGENNYITLIDGTKNPLQLEFQGNEESMLSPYGIYGVNGVLLNDIENIQSIAINGIDFKIK